MIKFKRSFSELRNYLPLPFQDVSAYSDNYFKLSEFPDNFYIGKNTFKILGNSAKLISKSKIYLDIVDANGNPIYYEILPVTTQERYKIVVVYIYDDTPPGTCKIYLGGRLKADPRNGVLIPYSHDVTSPNYINIPNVQWIRDVNVVVTKPNTSEVFFTTDPIIRYSKRSEAFRTSDGSTAVRTEVTSSDSFSIISVTEPAQLTSRNTNLNVKETAFRSEKNAVLTADYGETVNRATLPEFSHLTMVKSTTFEFSSSMVGGDLIFKNLSFGNYKPNDAVDPTVFNNIPDFSASVVSTLDKLSVYIDKPFSYSVEYLATDGTKKYAVLNNIIGHTNFTASYYEPIPSADTAVTASYISMVIRDLEPAGGTVDKIQVRYKLANVIGEYSTLGEYELKEQNLLIDPTRVFTTVEDGVVERGLGIFDSSTDLNYWTLSSGSVSQKYWLSLNSHYSRGVLVLWSGSIDASSYGVVSVANNYAMETFAGTEYVLSFDTFIRNDGTSSISPQLDVYISGSSIINEPGKNTLSVSPLTDRLLGQYVTSVLHSNGSHQTVKAYFRVEEDSTIVPKFVIRSGYWKFNDIKICPRKDIGYSPNHVKLNIPYTDFGVGGEVILDVSYLNSYGVKSNVGGKIQGLVLNNTDSDYNSKIGSINLSYRGDLKGSATMYKYLGTVNVPVSCSIENCYVAVSSSGFIQRLNFDVKSGLAANYKTEQYMNDQIVYDTRSFFFDCSTGSFQQVGGQFDTTDWYGVGQKRSSLVHFYASASGWDVPRDTLTTMMLVVRKI